MGQTLLPFPRAEAETCDHEYGFDCRACVPAGVVCNDCGMLLLQYIPQGPEVLGYVSADWAWHHIDGKPWRGLPNSEEPNTEFL